MIARDDGSRATMTYYLMVAVEIVGQLRVRAPIQTILRPPYQQRKTRNRAT